MITMNDYDVGAERSGPRIDATLYINNHLQLIHRSRVATMRLEIV
jgi:hypothetical protein